MRGTPICWPCAGACYTLNIGVMYKILQKGELILSAVSETVYFFLLGPFNTGYPIRSACQVDLIRCSIRLYGAAMSAVTCPPTSDPLCEIQTDGDPIFNRSGGSDRMKNGQAGTFSFDLPIEENGALTGPSLHSERRRICHPL